MNIEWQIPFSKENLRKNKAWIAGGALFSGLIILGAVSAQCEDIDPSGQSRNSDAGDIDQAPENDKGVRGISLQDGKSAYLSGNNF